MPNCFLKLDFLVGTTIYLRSAFLMDDTIWVYSSTSGNVQIVDLKIIMESPLSN